MIGRRQFLQFGPATLSGALVINWNHALAAMGSFEAHVLARGIYDPQSSAGQEFADTLASHGMRTTSADREIGALWYSDLRDQLRRSPAPFAGLTDRPTLFCLEELARDVGMRVVMRIDHQIDRSGLVTHEPIGPAIVTDTVRKLSNTDSFGRLAALLAMHPQVQYSHSQTAQKRTGADAPTHTNSLVTWVIA